MRLHAVFASAALLTHGCMFASAPSGAPQPADAPALEARLVEDSTDLRAFTALAALYLTQGQPERARALLARGWEAVPDDPAIPLLLAVAEERTGSYVSARTRYEAYRRARTGRLAHRAGERLVAITPMALRMEVRDAVALPSDTSAAEPRRVAVLPFSRPGVDEATLAETRGVATLIGWELADDWTVVDDARVRLLLEELNASSPALAEITLGAEVGRRLRAARVVQGSIRRVTLESVEWHVTMLSLDGGSLARVDQFSLVGHVAEVLPMQQRLSVLLREALEEEYFQDRVGTIFTVSTQALQSFGRGLAAMDRGDADAARAAFVEATELDPQFVRATDLVARMDVVLGAPSLDSLTVEIMTVGERQRAVQSLVGAPASLDRTETGRLGRSERTTVSELLGLDALNGGALLDLTFTLPGGSP